MQKISIIIPVYNTESYLRQCLDSIISQTLRDIEIICINDGSTDNSLNILKEYSEKDKRIIIIDQKNQGAASARNNGIRKACGKYLSILDSDDFFELDMLEKMYKSAEDMNSDIVLCNLAYYDKKSNEYQSEDDFFANLAVMDEPFSKKDLPDFFFQLTLPNAFNKLYKRDFIIGNNIYFQDLPSCNDISFTYKACYFAQKISTVREVLVNYRQDNNSSITKSRNETSASVIESYREILKSCEMDGALLNSFYYRILISFKYEYDLCTQEQQVGLLKKYKEFLPKKYWKEFLNLCKIPFWQDFYSQFNGSFSQNIFSVEKHSTHNIIRILGFKIKIKYNELSSYD